MPLAREQRRLAAIMAVDVVGYWEAGFAEGAQKPVFYTCERTKFSGAKTHFDTEHLFTILWDVSKPELAAEELKAVIRREFPADATPPNLSKT